MKKVMMLVVAVIALMLTGCKKEFTITVQSNNGTWGSVTGGGTYVKGMVISIEAKANSGYQFLKWQDGNTENPRSITVKSDETYVAIFVSEGGGGEVPSNKYVFSVSETQKVYFSPGNLQWSSTGTHAVAGGGTAAGTWRFAPNQLDTIGADNSNIDSLYTGWIDLFGWGTSGYNNKYPYMTSKTAVDYGEDSSNIDGTNYDWGVYNAIVNTATNATDAPGTWRTMTRREWRHLLLARTTPSGVRYAKSTVNGIAGLIVVPDEWNTSTYALDSINTTTATYNSNIITSADWAEMEAAGCVFLPILGLRTESYVRGVGVYGYYWSTTYYDNYKAFTLSILTSSLDPSGSASRFYGLPVRLVRDAQ